MKSLQHPSRTNLSFEAIEWDTFDEIGYFRLGEVPESELELLRKAIDEIMLGRANLKYEKLLMQLDSTSGEYSDLGPQTNGFKYATLEYRKIQGLEHQQDFRRYMTMRIFQDICRHVYGDQKIACFRAMLMNKPAVGGTLLPWHQDRWSYLDRDPMITVWTALDDATSDSGALEIIPGSHHWGVLNRAHSSSFLAEKQSNLIDQRPDIIQLTAHAGEVILLHNLLVHRSGLNRSLGPRRAFSVCYMDARTSDSSGSYTHLF